MKRISRMARVSGFGFLAGLGTWVTIRVQESNSADFNAIYSGLAVGVVVALLLSFTSLAD